MKKCKKDCGALKGVCMWFKQQGALTPAPRVNCLGNMSSES